MKYLPPLSIFALCMLFFTITNYGGIRAPDAEIPFRVGESLANNEGFALEEDLKTWPEFGVARGLDGKLYSVYPPLESILLAPCIKIAKSINRSRWYETFPLPVSHYVSNNQLNLGEGSFKQTWDPPTQDLEKHALRFLVSFFDLIVTALGVLVFWFLLLKLTGSQTAAFITTILYAFGTLTWPYAGTFYSEPLATLLILLSFYWLVCNDPHFQPGGEIRPPVLLISGLMLGLAVATHIMAILFAPFFLLYCCYICYKSYSGNYRKYLTPVLFWLSGFGALLILLGYFNFIRFGSFLETGRSLTQFNQYIFYMPWSRPFWRDLYGSLLSGGKGLFLFCPAVIFGLISWYTFHKQYPVLSGILAATALARVIFIASYFEWHGGYCIGPRYFLMLIPFLMIPFGFLLKEQAEQGRWRFLVIAAAGIWACISEQIYFAIGENFSYYHLIRRFSLAHNINIFENDFIYIDWSVSPLLYLLKFKRSPFFLQHIPVSNQTLWLTGSLLWLVLISVGLLLLKKIITTEDTEFTENREKIK